MKETSYNGKYFTIPQHSKNGFEIIANKNANKILIPFNDPIIKDLNSVWNLNKFMTERKPVSLGKLSDAQLEKFRKPGVLRTLDMPIKFPGSNFRIPENLSQFSEIIQIVANYEIAVNNECYDEYYCYLTVDQGWVEPNELQREAPCHVDGFQGARWNPKTKINHTYVVTDAIPTTYYVQPFDFSHLDEAKHNFFWEMNKIVAETKSKFAWQPEDGEINLIDAYTVHRGSPAREKTFRTWIRLSFEVRQFDRLGNAHNPLFKYNWNMVKRDIESLNLVAYDQNSDPSLRVFPWQDTDGKPLETNGVFEKGRKTQPKLT